MLTRVALQNPYDLLGNEDGDAAAAAPVKTAKADAKAAPARRTGASGNEAAFRDRNAGADRNRSKPTDEASRGGARGGSAARVRGGRGGRFPRDRDDRHSKGLPGATEKHAGGNTEGESEKRDEEAGEAIAKSDEKAAANEDAAPEEEAEPEEKQLSYDDYLAQQAEKKLAIDGPLAVRQANEGTKANKQWAAAKALVKDDDEDFIAGGGGKTKRERERKVKQVVEIDQRFVEQPERTRGGFRGGRGGRGGERGDRSERPERGDRAERGDRPGRGGPRGGPRGGARGRGEPRGAPRGGAPRGAPRGGANLNPKDESAFPSLGS
ncbi:plasminogen activator inhibitor 1 RNA-binding protein [Sporothrix schenckii 1099-18]|uniref:Hyaluronan/mRNA-binding protein domain-containing protein n=2 Tax=Sporothrix schenckii TaxID=29908 RepID=U7PR81_SPOS1|nr:plasminogen activator inhibitor 1 RNA-binding protein [Sporothrix schenckii 1099-18]ERS97259.1 hypothetical protein HMPREF1624_06590 [Sporothrix schenckii ATCC 58251]KJR86489.1 plasminogen activator inhibitor 1 RNA-binding protein [Sporothrix schenckii 1099-18]